VKLPRTGFHPVDESLIPEDITKLPRPSRRIMEVLKKGGATSVATAPKSWSLDFCMSPISFGEEDGTPYQLGSMDFEKTGLSPGPFDPAAKAEGTGEVVQIPCSLAFRSIGYKSRALPGFKAAGIPFNTSAGVIPNDHLGRVIDVCDQYDPFNVRTEKHIPGLYCAGWVKRGPTGVIASTMEDAFSTADSIAWDWYNKLPFLNAGGSTGLGWEGIKAYAENNQCRRVSWADWKRIDSAEKEKGQLVGKEREKFTKVEEMLSVLD
jgi:adrenodoxin-NADP+ reductase